MALTASQFVHTPAKIPYGWPNKRPRSRSSRASCLVSQLVCCSSEMSRAMLAARKLQRALPTPAAVAFLGEFFLANQQSD